jgi:hypothetical protein
MADSIGEARFYRVFWRPEQDALVAGQTTVTGAWRAARLAERQRRHGFAVRVEPPVPAEVAHRAYLEAESQARHPSGRPSW